MQTLTTINQIQNWAKKIKSQSKTTALVPTMGGIHGGHLALVSRAQEVADVVVVSIFINTAQFGKNEDFAAYPRNIAEDSRILANVSVDVIFTPSEREIYPLAQGFKIQAPSIANKYCGASRPVFFHGISLAVLKLLNIIRPNYALFGQKDWQQLHIVKLLARDFFLPTKIIDVPTARENDGVAMSTRNQYLDNKQRKEASLLYQTLVFAKGQIEQKEDIASTKKEALSRLGAVFVVDYFETIDETTLLAVNKPTNNMRIIAGVYLGKIRLIDNIKVDYV